MHLFLAPTQPTLRFYKYRGSGDLQLPGGCIGLLFDELRLLTNSGY